MRNSRQNEWVRMDRGVWSCLLFGHFWGRTLYIVTWLKVAQSEFSTSIYIYIHVVHLQGYMCICIRVYRYMCICIVFDMNSLWVLLAVEDQFLKLRTVSRTPGKPSNGVSWQLKKKGLDGFDFLYSISSGIFWYIMYPRCRQNLHHACARERFGSQNR